MLATSRPGVSLVHVKGEPVLRVSYNAYRSMIDELIVMLHKKKLPINQVYGIWRGGVPIAIAISESLGIPDAVIAAQTQGIPEGMECGHSVAKKYPWDGKVILLVDDLIKGGTTMAGCKRHLETVNPGCKVLTAVLWTRKGKKAAGLTPDFAVDTVELVDGKLPYIDQPQEHWKPVTELLQLYGEKVAPAKPEPKKVAPAAEAAPATPKRRRHRGGKGKKRASQPAAAAKSDNGKTEATPPPPDPPACA